ncbi:MAG: single-stranded DNA-binding protein [Bacteroidales bacterium]|nr:single-stranded DNA-binding protein [Bacteroidales bacterium]
MNKIELRGIVGRSEIGSYNGNRVCNFSVVTEYSSRDKDGNSAIESQWFNVSLWETRDNPKPEMDKIMRGTWVHLYGRLRVRKYTTVDNEERSSLDIFANNVTVIDRDDISMQPQRDY